MPSNSYERILIHLNPKQDEEMQCQVFSEDELGPGGAHHRYILCHGPKKDLIPQRIRFQHGPMTKPEESNGTTHEALLGVVADRLSCFQAGPYACEENAQALDHVIKAIDALHARTNKRLERGVEGTHEV